jgi:hypothetical protein
MLVLLMIVLNKIKNNSKLSEDFNESELNNYFNSIEDMKDYYSSFINELDVTKKRKSKEQILEELTIKCDIKFKTYQEQVDLKHKEKVSCL